MPKGTAEKGGCRSVVFAQISCALYARIHSILCVFLRTLRLCVHLPSVLLCRL